MLTLTVKVGEAVQIGETVCIGVGEKSGKAVKLTIATVPEIRPVTIIRSGIFPVHFITGANGERIANDNSSQEGRVTG